MEYMLISGELEELLKKGEECAKEQCSENGFCVVEENYFESVDTEGSEWTKLFKEGECICNSEFMGHDCKTPYDAARAVDQAERAAKILVWSTVNKKDSIIKEVHTRDAHTSVDYEEIGYGYLNKSNEWLVFPTGGYVHDFKRQNENYDSDVIIVNRKEAMDSKVVAIPTQFKMYQNSVKNKETGDLIYPVCPSDYTPIGRFYQKHNHSDKDQIENVKLYKDNSVHCIHSSYMISEVRA